MPERRRSEEGFFWGVGGGEALWRRPLCPIVEILQRWKGRYVWFRRERWLGEIE